LYIGFVPNGLRFIPSEPFFPLTPKILPPNIVTGVKHRVNVKAGGKARVGLKNVHVRNLGVIFPHKMFVPFLERLHRDIAFILRAIPMKKLIRANRTREKDFPRREII
jgi:hypothetical protein